MDGTLTEKQLDTYSGSKFSNPDWTLGGAARASVALNRLDTLWFNTGTVCNLTCANCYIESSPTNDRLSFLTAIEVARTLDELKANWRAEEVGFTGGEPFVNPEFLKILDSALVRDYRALILTNAMRPMMKAPGMNPNKKPKEGSNTYCGPPPLAKTGNPINPTAK